ncbi:MAG: hypothetical protein P8O07_05985 [Crocinitomicaceae bacterium]|nr:hypothetical protein [Crocinitomicaceae bacterium]
MKRFYLVTLCAAIFALGSCTSYEDKEYGPVSFEVDLEGGEEMLFEGPNEAISTIAFNPEEYGFPKESVGGMRLKSITLNTTNEEGFNVFENLKVEVSSENTEMLVIGVLNSSPEGKSVTIEGLEEAKIEKFNEVSEFFLHISGNLTKDLESVFTITGEFTLNVESSEK